MVEAITTPAAAVQADMFDVCETHGSYRLGPLFGGLYRSTCPECELEGHAGSRAAATR